MIEETKPWWQSVTIIGGMLATLAPLIGALTHLTFGVAETNEIAVSVVGIVSGIGGLMAVWGRVRSGQTPTKITLTKQ